MIVSQIVAVGRRNEIGKDGAMPWHLPADLKHFKANTLGKPVLMGRKTLLAIGRPLPERRNLVLTRDAAFKAAGCETVTSLEQAMTLAGPAPELMVIGGGEVYRLAWSRTDRVYLTRIEATVEGADTFFPEMDPALWREISRDDHRADGKNPYDYSFLTYDRVK
jgi:dihydrofolate reductase